MKDQNSWRQDSLTWKVLVVVILVAVAVGLIVHGLVTETQIRTISEVKSSGVREGGVAVHGKIVYASDNKFILADETGKAELETCPLWYKRISLREGDEVTVIGEVMRNPSLTMKTDLVLSVYKIYRGKEEISVRRRPGKPPWKSHRLPQGALPPSGP